MSFVAVGGDAPSVDVIPGKDGEVLISVVPPVGSRRPVDVIAVVDVSGSMGESADSVHTASLAESTGLSILDVVRHALKAIVSTMNANDSFALVTYSSEAQEALPFTPMDATGQQIASTVVGQMVADGQTAMWSGIEKGLDLLRVQAESRPTTGKSLFVFTDGVPTLVPPRGHQGMLERYSRKHGGLPGSLSTFGFGYSLDSALLEDLAAMGNGTYSFIPDVGMVGTVFVHAVANALSCLSSTCQVRVSVPGNIIDAWVSTTPQGKRAVKKAGQPELLVELGQVNYGQTRDFVIKVAGCTAEDCRVEARLGEVALQGRVLAPSPESVAVQRARVEMVR